MTKTEYTAAVLTAIDAYNSAVDVIHRSNATGAFGNIFRFSGHVVRLGMAIADIAEHAGLSYCVDDDYRLSEVPDDDA